jgi:hypothetical protein
MNLRALRPILLAIALFLIADVGVARADIVLAADAVPAPAEKIKEFFSGRSWMWPCKKCGAYFNPYGTFVAIGFDKGTSVVGHGTWAANDGQLCWDATWARKGGTDPVKHECWEMKYGASKNKKYKSVLAIKYRDKNAYFWAYQDKQVWKEFVKGDRVSKNAVKIEGGFSS